MWKMKAHGLALAHRAFVGFLALWASLLEAFFNVGFFGPSPHGPGPNPVGWAKLTPLSTTKIVKNPINYERSKHIDMHFHFIREQVKEVFLQKIVSFTEDKYEEPS